MKIYAGLLALAVFFSGCEDIPQAEQVYEEEPNPIAYSMDNSASLMLENPEINSVSIGVYRDGEKYVRFYGEIDKGMGNPPDDRSLFELASVTKTFTGILVARAVLDQKVNLDDDIRLHLDGEYPNLEYEGRPIQIRDLLTHTAGLTRDFPETLTNMFSSDLSADEKALIANYTTEKLLEDLPSFTLKSTPGTQYEYSPVVGPEILAAILENVYQQPFAELLDQHILQKAQMENTVLKAEASNANTRVNEYTDEGELADPFILSMRGAGAGLKSTIPDMLNYIEYLLDSGDPAVEESKRRVFVDEEEGDEYGYFWILSDTDFMHNGGTAGSTSWVVLMPELNSGFIVMFNSNGDRSGNLINRIANLIYDDLESYPTLNAYFPVRAAILDNTESGIQQYMELKQEHPDRYNFNDGSVLNRIGYELLRKDRTSDAISVFKLLVSEFPDASNPYDSLGEGYYVDEQYDLALENYEKSLELNPENGNARKMIEEIKELMRGGL